MKQKNAKRKYDRETIVTCDDTDTDKVELIT
jgi:hypothetical protein